MTRTATATVPDAIRAGVFDGACLAALIVGYDDSAAAGSRMPSSIRDLEVHAIHTSIGAAHAFGSELGTATSRDDDVVACIPVTSITVCELVVFGFIGCKAEDPTGAIRIQATITGVNRLCDTIRESEFDALVIWWPYFQHLVGRGHLSSSVDVGNCSQVHVSPSGSRTPLSMLAAPSHWGPACTDAARQITLGGAFA